MKKRISALSFTLAFFLAPPVSFYLSKFQPAKNIATKDTLILTINHAYGNLELCIYKKEGTSE